MRRESTVIEYRGLEKRISERNPLTVSTMKDIEIHVEEEPLPSYVGGRKKQSEKGRIPSPIFLFILITDERSI